MRITRLLIAPLALAALLSAAAGTRAAPGPEKVVIAQGFVGGADVTLQTAQKLGLFEKYGVAVEIDVMNSTQAIQSLIAGKVQVMFGAPALWCWPTCRASASPGTRTPS